MTPVLPSWADNPVTKTGISPSQVKALPPAGTALAPDLAELFRYDMPVRRRFMGEIWDKEGRSKAEGLKLCSLRCMSCGRGDVLPLRTPRATVSRGVQVATSPTCSEGEAGSRLKRWRFLQQRQGSCPSFYLPVLFSVKQNFSGFSLW